VLKNTKDLDNFLEKQVKDMSSKQDKENIKVDHKKMEDVKKKVAEEVAN
jgi:hypothetical protein